MISKTATELRKILGLDRNTFQRLEDKAVITPNKIGQGIATEYSADDISKLIDVKLLLLSGFRVSEMPQLLCEEYYPDNIINEQIRMYKRRIAMLEFVSMLRGAYEEFSKVSQTSETANGKAGLLSDSFDMEYGFCSLEFLFLLDEFSQVHFRNELDDSTTYKGIAERVSDLLDCFSKIESEASKDELMDILIELSEQDISDKEIGAFYKELSNLLRIAKMPINVMVSKVFSKKACKDKQLMNLFKRLYKQLASALSGYFLDQYTLRIIIRNLQEFIRKMDTDAYKLNGTIRRRKGV